MEQATYTHTVNALVERGVDLNDLAQIVWDMQLRYAPDLTLPECLEHIKKVLDKREVQHAILTGISLDKLAEKNLLEEPLLSIVKRDEGLYGVDEILALSIVNCYGSIGLTNFGWLDKEKIGIIGDFDSKKDGAVHTFLDDILCGICAAACSRLAHHRSEEKERK